jgi:hypothetical protein
VVTVVVDKSPSQNFGDRIKQTETARAQLAERLGRIPGLDLRFVEAGEADGETDGTKLISALSASLADVPPDRVAGAILLTDGRVHDVPGEVAALGFNAPVHALITGARNERDRRVVLVTTPRFGIVGQSQTIVYRVEDQGARPSPAEVTIRRDGEVLERRSVRRATRRARSRPVRTDIVESSVTAQDELLGQQPRRGAIDGVRAVAGAAVPASRTGGAPATASRRQRRSRARLRPPEARTPDHEYPDRVSDHVSAEDQDFRLIIFDRYAARARCDHLFRQHRAMCGGQRGAGHCHAGYASQTSIWRRARTGSPAEPAAKPSNALRPELSDLGKRHPVTRGLVSADQARRTGAAGSVGRHPRRQRHHHRKAPTRSRCWCWPRGEAGSLLLSMHRLWARLRGGGPHLDLMRRLSHWLMSSRTWRKRRCA